MFSKRFKFIEDPPGYEGTRHAALLHYPISVQGTDAYEERAEGKIKETGTMRRRFLGKPLSAHYFGAALAAPSLSTPRAATARKALVLLGFERHHSPKSAIFRGFAPEALA